MFLTCACVCVYLTVDQATCSLDGMWTLLAKYKGHTVSLVREEEKEEEEDRATPATVSLSLMHVASKYGNMKRLVDPLEPAHIQYSTIITHSHCWLLTIWLCFY